MQRTNSAGMNPQTEEQHSLSPIHIAASAGLTKLERCLNEGGDPNVTNSKNWTPLHFVFMSDQYNPETRDVAIRLLLERGGKSSIDQKAAEEGYTALHVAILKNDLRSVNTLLEFGADTSICDAKDTPPLGLLAQKILKEPFDIEILNALLAKSNAAEVLTFKNFIEKGDRDTISNIRISQGTRTKFDQGQINAELRAIKDKINENFASASSAADTRFSQLKELVQNTNEVLGNFIRLHQEIKGTSGKPTEEIQNSIIANRNSVIQLLSKFHLSPTKTSTTSKMYKELRAEKLVVDEKVVAEAFQASIKISEIRCAKPLFECFGAVILTGIAKEEGGSESCLRKLDRVIEARSKDIEGLKGEKKTSRESEMESWRTIKNKIAESLQEQDHSTDQRAAHGPRQVQPQAAGAAPIIQPGLRQEWPRPAPVGRPQTTAERLKMKLEKRKEGGDGR